MIRSKALIPLVLLLGAVPVIAATPADQVKTRQDGLKALGGAMKKLSDTLKGDGDMATIKMAAADIQNASKWQYSWFPKGTAADTPGLKTAAKPEIWSKPAEFKAAQDGFAKEATALKVAADSGNLDAVKAQFPKVGGACKTCHENFRVPHD